MAERPSSPALARGLLRLFLRGEAATVIAGDIEEEFHDRVLPARGRRAARTWYWRQTLSSIRHARRPAARVLPRPPIPSPVQLMDNLIRDSLYALRSWRRQPVITAAALLALALGIGANAAIFSVVYGVLLQPLRLAEPDRLMTLWLDNTLQGWPKDVTSYPNFADWRDWNESFESMAAHVPQRDSLTGSGEPEQLRGRAVSPEFFDVLGASAALGRTFAASDWETDERVVVLSDALWRGRFAADPNILGSSLTLSGTPHTVVGVMPPDFAFLRPDIQHWRLFDAGIRESSRGSLWLSVVGRLRPEVTVEQARADMARVAARLGEEFPDYYEGYGVTIVPLHEEIVGEVGPALMLLLGAVALVLLIACANVANLMLARATARRREIAIRAALGSSRARLLRQTLTESVLLSLAGGLLGMLLATGGLRVLRMLEPSLPRLTEIGIQGPVIAFAAIVTLLTGVLFGIVPALQSAAQSPGDALRERGSDGSSTGRRFRTSLVAVEVALALMLLTGAGLLVRSYVRVLEQGPGFDPENVLSFELRLGPPTYEDGADNRAFVVELMDRLEALPGVDSVASVRTLPMDGGWSSGFFSIEGRPVPERSELVEVKYNIVTVGYFDTLRIPVIAGRGFDTSDTRDGEPVVIVSETFARTWFADQDPVGQRFLFGLPEFYDADEELPWARIIGVVGDVRQRNLERAPEPEVYAPHEQSPSGTLNMVLRSELPPDRLAETVRTTVWGIDSDLPIASIRTLGSIVSDTTGPRRFNLVLLAAFAGVALTLTLIGIYGVVSYWVGRLTHDIGIRMALGARGSDVMRMVMRHSVAVVGAGVALGLVGSALLARSMRSLVFDIEPIDPLTMSVVAALLVAVALAASWLPARRATRVDPLEALRDE